METWRQIGGCWSQCQDDILGCLVDSGRREQGSDIVLSGQHQVSVLWAHSWE